MEINPQWRHAVEANVCPFCGKAVMDEHLKNLLATLAETMDKLQTYSTQLDDWMLSNHSYIKTSAPDLVKYLPEDLLKSAAKVDDDFQKRKVDQDKKFTVKVKTESGEQEVVAERVQSEDKTNEFFKRAEAVKPNIEGYRTTAEKTEHLKRVAQQIKKSGSLSLVNEEGAGIMISPETLENADEEAIAEYEASLSSGHIVSSLPDPMDDEIPSVVLAMASKGNAKQNAADILKLQQQQDRTRRSREAFESGENRSKPGGFSRGG
jgi:DNA polymerase I-like protein with 3'-5' exonuclease and polymerase domains